eukprot:4453231-Pleurochrysis_carterae.AAC.1
MAHARAHQLAHLPRGVRDDKHSQRAPNQVCTVLHRGARRKSLRGQMESATLLKAMKSQFAQGYEAPVCSRL